MHEPLSYETLSERIGQIYDCALDPSLWPATLERLRLELDLHNAALSLMSLPDGAFLLNISTGIPSPYLERVPDYGQHVIEQWGGLDKLNSLTFDEPVILTQVNPRERWWNLRYAVEWARPQGIHDVLAVGLARNASLLGSLACGRHQDKGEIGDYEMRAMRFLLPHLQRAVAIGKLLDLKTAAAATFSATLDALSAAVVLTDADLKIVHANAAGEAMLSLGVPIRSDGGRLALPSAAATGALGQAVKQAAENESSIGKRGFGIPVARNGAGPHILHVLPLKHGEFRPGLMPGVAAAIFVAPAVNPQPLANEALAALFDLTPAEARIFDLIGVGKTPAEIGVALGISLSTVKTHLLHIFSKTGASRQADLIRLAAALALPLQA